MPFEATPRELYKCLVPTHEPQKYMGDPIPAMQRNGSITFTESKAQ